MKRVNIAIGGKPASAAAWQDFVCELSDIMSNVLGIVIPILEAIKSMLESLASNCNGLDDQA